MRFALTPWRSRRADVAPASDMQYFALQERINRMFEDFLQGFGMEPFDLSQAQGDATPRVDITETDTHMRVTAELPGVAEKDVEVFLEDGALTIRGEKKAEKETKEGGVHRLERSFGSFQRRIPLPIEVQDDGVAATFKNGVLTVELRKSEPDARKAKRIEVRSK